MAAEMGAEQTMIIELSGGRLRVLTGALEGGAFRVEDAFGVDVPEELADAEGAEFGKWLRAALKARSVGAKRVWVALGRADVIIKALFFERVEDPDADLPGMVRLQMARQLSIPMEESAIDYSVVDHEEGSGWRVLAGAAPEARVRWWRDGVKGAGLTLGGLGVVGQGIALLGAAHELENSGPSMIVVAGCGQLEISIAQGGRVLFTRSSMMNETESDELLRRRIITEVRRTWTSYRVTTQARDVGSVIVLGDEGHATALAETCAEAMAIPGFGFSEAALLDCSGIGGGDGGGEAQEIALRLGGLGLASAQRDKVMDFASPRRAPDRGARKRQAAMLVVLAVILGLGSVLTLGLRDVRGLREQAELLRERAGEAESQASRAALELARLEHLRAWRAGEVSWLEHLDVVASKLASADEVVLDRVTAQASARIDYDRRGRRRAFDPKYMERGVLIEIDVTGRASSRAVAERVRGAFVEDARYLVRPVGEDGRETNDPRYPHAFSFRLLTSQTTPEEEAETVAGGGS